MTATSFFPAKPLGCYGDGGAVFTDDDELAEVVRSLLFHGKGTSQYDNVRIGMTGRMDSIQAGILIEKLAIFADEIEARQTVAERYTQGLSGVVATPGRSRWPGVGLGAVHGAGARRPARGRSSAG